MQLSMEEAATRLGKSLRQIRYMIQCKRIPARKVAGRWMVELEDVPASPGQEQAASRKQQRLREAVEDALDLNGRTPARYSLQDLRAFQIALPLYQGVVRSAGTEHPAAGALRRALEHLARGCHRYDHAAKGDAYRAARDEASLAVCELLLAPVKSGEGIVRSIEQDLMAALAGLLRRMERRHKP